MKQGWEIKKLGEVATFINGDRSKNYPSQNDFISDGIPFINAGHLNGGEIAFSSMNYISDEKYNLISSGKILEGDILFCLRGSLGKRAIVKGISHGVIASSLVIIRCHKVTNKYLYYYLESPKVFELVTQNNNGSSQPNLSAKSVSNFLIPVPPIEEQERIVEELDCLNGVIERKREQLKELDRLAQSIFYTMFGDPITNEKGFPIKKLGELFEVSSGGTPNTKNISYWEDGDISWIGSNMCQNSIIYQNDNKYITQEGLIHSSAKEYKPGYVLVALVGATLGKVALLRFSTTTNQNIAGVNVPANKNFTSEFVFYVIQNLYSLFKSVGGDKFKMANLSFVRSLNIPVPQLSLQQEFADKIEAIEKQKQLIKESIAECEQLFNERMEHYFS